ncbi:DUF5458 family protein [Niabella beijingensis]|uniref:DUF5458 family protein n=1 Tax=Niabella beijingensis TaxID=2872700 RepID=UPI001CC07F9E|nr:DUF5458 family protein [Niabella beijingensis]MBZ4188368.1 DUF5458 family protein [Niabella beijingensis]
MTGNTVHQNEPDRSAAVTGGEPFSGELFLLLAGLIEGVSYLDQEHEARRAVFIQENDFRRERRQLLNRLQLWEVLLGAADDDTSVITDCEKELADLQRIYENGLAHILNQTRTLERAYRAVTAFFMNTEKDILSNISFVNAGLEQLKETEHPVFIDFVREELKKNYDRLDLRDHYSLLVVPGYLGAKVIVDTWAKLAHENKVMLVTDFEHLDEPDDVMELFDRVQHAGGEKFLSSVMMTCNWLIARGRYVNIEEEDLYMPPSAALAGKLYHIQMSQVAAGKKFGMLKGVNGVAFELKKSEVANLEKMSLIPMVKEQGSVIAFSAKTLFSGDNMGLQTYSVVRVFDYVTKVLIDFLNRRAFENFNANTRRELMTQLVMFLDSISGPRKLVENFTIRRFEQDAVKKDNIHLDIFMKPYFPAKNFLIKMEGQKNDGGNSWDTDYDDS